MTVQLPSMALMELIRIEREIEKLKDLERAWSLEGQEEPLGKALHLHD